MLSRWRRPSKRLLSIREGQGVELPAGLDAEELLIGEVKKIPPVLLILSVTTIAEMNAVAIARVEEVKYGLGRDECLLSSEGICSEIAERINGNERARRNQRFEEVLVERKPRLLAREVPEAGVKPVGESSGIGYVG